MPDQQLLSFLGYSRNIQMAKGLKKCVVNNDMFFNDYKGYVDSWSEAVDTRLIRLSATRKPLQITMIRPILQDGFWNLAHGLNRMYMSVNNIIHANKLLSYGADIITLTHVRFLYSSADMPYPWVYALKVIWTKSLLTPFFSWCDLMVSTAFPSQLQPELSPHKALPSRDSLRPQDWPFSLFVINCWRYVLYPDITAHARTYFFIIPFTGILSKKTVNLLDPPWVFYIFYFVCLFLFVCFFFFDLGSKLLLINEKKLRIFLYIQSL